MFDANTPSNYWEFYISGAATDNTTWVSFPITYIFAISIAAAWFAFSLR